MYDMKQEKPKEPDALEKELERMIRKLISEKEALGKILTNSGQGKIDK
jgi:hypothetical protein